MGKIAVIVGSSAIDRGPERASDGMPEYVWAGHLAAAIQRLAPDRVRIFRRLRGTASDQDVYRIVDIWGADCAIELRLGGDIGCETVATRDGTALTLAGRVQEAAAEALGGPDRGVRVTTKRSKEGRVLSACAAPAVIVRPLSASDPEDCARADAVRGDLARAIFLAAQDFAATRPYPAK